jgi:hypothetical protein
VGRESGVWPAGGINLYTTLHNGRIQRLKSTRVPDRTAADSDIVLMPGQATFPCRARAGPWAEFQAQARARGRAVPGTDTGHAGWAVLGPCFLGPCPCQPIVPGPSGKLYPRCLPRRPALLLATVPAPFPSQLVVPGAKG